MGLVFHGCERVGEGRGLCVTAASDQARRPRADVKTLRDYSNAVRQGRANGWLKSTHKPSSKDTVAVPSGASVFKVVRGAQPGYQDHVKAGANIPRGNYQSFTIRICAGQKRMQEDS